MVVGDKKVDIMGMLCRISHVERRFHALDVFRKVCVTDFCGMAGKV